jgi:hypothetical protein
MHHLNGAPFMNWLCTIYGAPFHAPFWLSDIPNDAPFIYKMLFFGA